MNRTAPFNHRELFVIACMAIERLARYRHDATAEACHALQQLKERCEEALAERLCEGVTGERPGKIVRPQLRAWIRKKYPSRGLVRRER
jgi:hypothetical protein